MEVLHREKSKTEQTQHDERHIVTSPFVNDVIGRALNYLSAGFPVHLTGPSGIGKTTIALHVARKLKKPVLLIHGNHEMTNADLIGGFVGYTNKRVVDNYIHSVYKIEEESKGNWKDGRLLEAVREGYTVVYDEFARSKPETNSLFLSVLQEKVLPLYGTKGAAKDIRVHSDFRIIFTSNPDEYVGVYQSPDALLDRLITIDLDPMDTESMQRIITNQSGVSEGEAASIAQFVSSVGEATVDRKRSSSSLRASLMIASIAKKSGISIDPNNKQFQALCMDAVWHFVGTSADANERTKIRKAILAKIHKMPKGDN